MSASLLAIGNRTGKAAPDSHFRFAIILIDSKLVVPEKKSEHGRFRKLLDLYRKAYKEWNAADQGSRVPKKSRFREDFDRQYCASKWEDAFSSHVDIAIKEILGPGDGPVVCSYSHRQFLKKLSELADLEEQAKQGEGRGKKKDKDSGGTPDLPGAYRKERRRLVTAYQDVILPWACAQLCLLSRPTVIRWR